MTKLDQYLQRLGIEVPGATAKAIDVEAGKAGYEKYLADVEAFKTAQDNAIAESESKKSWWDKVSNLILQANQMSATMTDSPASTGFNQAVAAYKSIPDDYNSKPTDDWTDDERWAFGEKYATNSDDAYAFAKDLNSRKAKEQKQKQQEAIAKWSGKNLGTGLLGSAASLGLNTIYGGLGYLDALAQKAAGREVEQNILLPHEAAGAMQSGVATKLNEKGGTLNENIPVIGGKGWGDVYGLGMSFAQSRIAVASGNQAYTLAMFFGMSASQGVTDALSRGATGDQAIAYGTIAGLAEAIPEMISVDKLLGIESKEGVQNLFKNILKQAGEEAGEEFTTSLINNVADNWIMGGKSQFYQTVNQLVASGMSVEEAKRKAWIQTIEDIAFDTISGATSGAISGGISTGKNRIRQQFLETEKNENAKKTLGPQQSQLIEDAKQYDSTKKRASALEKKVAEGKELSGYELRMLASQVNEASRAKDVDTVRKAIVDKMKAEGVSESQAKVLGEIALNKAIGNDVSKVQELMLKRNTAAMKVYNQISAEVMESGIGESEWATKTPIERLRFEKQLTDALSGKGTVQTQTKTDATFNQVKGKYTEVDGKITYKTSGENSRLHIDGITSSLTANDIIELSAVEKIANALGVDVHVYETTVNEKGERTYTDKTGKKLSDSGYYDPNDNSIHIDLRAGDKGEGTMLYTASHEVVHFIKENAAEHYDALETLVTRALIKGGFSMEKAIEVQRKKAIGNGQTLTDEQLREEVIAEACQSFLASKNAVAEIQALKSENKGLWTALKKFFTSFFNKINKLYKETPPDAPEGKYIADMHKSAKKIRDAFLEGAVEAGKRANAKTTTTEKTAAKEVKSQARVTSEQDAAYLDAVKRGDMETAQKMVDEAAKKAGYTVKAYHGTKAFGFTEFDTEKSDDKRSLFAAGSTELAQTYSGKHGTKKLSDNKNIDGLSNEEVVKMLNAEATQSYEGAELQTEYDIMTLKDVNNLINEVNDGIDDLQKVLEGKIKEYADKMARDFDDKDAKTHSRLIEANELLKAYEYKRLSTPLYVLLHYTDALESNPEVADLEYKIRLMNKLTDADTSNGVVVKKYLGGYGVSILTFDKAREELKGLISSGNYDLYGKPGRQLVIDAKGQNWNNIKNWIQSAYRSTKDTYVNKDDMYYRLYDSDTNEQIFHGRIEITDKNKDMSIDSIHPIMVQKANNALAIRSEYMRTTRDIAKFAKDEGYDSVKFENLVDNGGAGESVEAGDVYVYFNPSDLKSADAVTYDDNGNVIPLSERFNEKSKDIRHKARSVDKYTEKEYNKDDLYTASDEFIKEIPVTLRSDFARSLANKTSDMYEGEIRTLYISGYIFEADGYMHGHLLTPYNEKTKKLLEAKESGYNKIDKDREGASVWTKAVQHAEQGSSGNSNLSERRRSSSDDTLLGTSSGRNASRNNERVWQTFKTEEEIDRIVQQLKELYGLNEDKEIRHKARRTDNFGNVLTEAQSEYFKDSKVRDSDGNLLVVYHGTRKADFTEFKRNINFFTDSEEMADSYSPNGEKHVGYLNITKPLVIDAKGERWSRIPIDAETKAMLDAYGSSSFKEGGKWRSTPADIASAIEEGVDEGEFDYDGIIINNLDDTGSYAKSSKKIIANDYIAFSSSQFKNTTNTAPTNSKDIRRKSRSTVTSGQYAQMKANLSHSKVYSKKSAMELVSKIAPGIRNRSFEDLSTRLWEGLNTYTALDDKIAFATDMAEIFVDKMVVDTLVKHSEWDSAVERMAYLKPAIGTIDFRAEDVSELKYMLDKNYSSLRSRWGYKTPSDGSFKRAYGLDEFISDLSREMPGMEHLAEMHPAEALIEVDKLYTDLQEQIKEKYESAYGDMSNEELNEIKRMIATEIMSAYSELGEQTKISKYLAEKFEYYQSRIDFWKAENARIKDVSRWNGIISTKALQIKELKKGAFYNATQHHQDVFKGSIEKLANVQWRGNLKTTQRVSEIFAELSKWYTMKNPMLHTEGADNNLYSETIATYISKIADSKGAFDENTYAMVYDVMNHLYTMMRNYNKVFRAGRWEDAPDLVNEYLKIMEQTKRDRNLLTRLQRGYNTEFLEPMAVAKHADGYEPNGFFTHTMEDLRRASINASIGEMNLRREYDAFIDANKKYLMNAAKETVNYRGVAIPKIYLIGLYMTMKREHSRAGLALSGFEFTVKNKWWDSEDKIYVKGYVTPGDNVTQEMINSATATEMSTIEKTFTDTDRQYISILEKLFNEDLKALKVERDMERQGYTNATLDYYYPIIRGAMAENIDTSKISDQNRATNSSFNKNTVKGAKQRLVIISADAMVNRHITDMCKYYYMSQAIENYNVLYNCDVSGNPNDPLNIAKIVQENKVWEKDVAYFKKLVKDMQGIREPQTAVEKFVESMRGNYAKFALGLNLKVLCTQFSSMIAAGDVIGFGSILSKDALTVSTADLYKYCPLAEVRSYDKTVLKAMTLTDKFGKFSEMFTAGISKVDSLVVSRLFAACQVEAQKQGKGELGTEENKIAAGKLLEKVIIETQQNSYATERSQAMRSKNEFLKAITMFTADGMKIVSRMHESFGELQVAKKSGDDAKIKKAKKKFAKSVAVAVNIAIYMSAIAWAFGLIYDREEEEDETGWDKMLHLTLDVTGNFISALPGVSELYDYCVNGFEVEGVAFDTFNNLLSGINNIRKDLESIVTQSGERTIEDINRDLRTLLYGVGQATGLPFRNVYNLARGIIGNTSSKAGYYLDSKFYKTNLATDLEEALARGNNSKANYILGLLYGERVNKEVSNAQRDEVVRLSKLGYKVLPKDIPDKIKRDGKEYNLTASQKDAISTEYSKVVAQIDKLISSSFYKSLTNKDRAYMIDYYHDKYYEMAVNKALGITDKNTAIYNAIGFRTYARLAYTTKDITSDKDKNGNTIAGSKKEKVIVAVGKTGITEEKRLLYIASLGYKLTDAEQTKLIKYLNSLSVSSSTKKNLAEMCGFEYKNGKIYAKDTNKR